jgi:hypothetical protein
MRYMCTYMAIYGASNGAYMGAAMGHIFSHTWPYMGATYGGSPIVSPFLCTPDHLLRSLSHVRPLPNRPLPIGLSRHCTRCFAKSPSYRPPTLSSSTLPCWIQGLNERQNLTLSFATLCLPAVAAAPVERRWFHFGTS